MSVTARLSGLSVFLPSYNEEGNVERVVRGFVSELPRITDDYEIIVVDDGSRDGTGQIADRLAAENARIKVVHHQANRGYGAAVRSGLQAASKAYVLLCDGDGQFDPSEVALLAAHVPEYDAVVGRRVRRADHLIRKLNGQAWTWLVRALFGIRIHDIDCGFKLFTRKSLEGLELHAAGAMISTELMARLAKRRARVMEVEVGHLPRLSGTQSGAHPRVIIRAFKELFALYGELKTGREHRAQGE